MSLADREVYLAEFWNQNNPDPTQRNNPLRQEFLSRVAYANLHYSAFGRKGMVTDRGRIYIRFGAPDEVYSELIPTVDSQLSNLVSQLADGNPGRETLESADAVDVRPYEIWEYTQQGRPLFPNREVTTSRTGLQFVFVDETGTGHYVLRYSSDFINY
jgi:GWxTD domain-containing protein